MDENLRAQTRRTTQRPDVSIHSFVGGGASRPAKRRRVRLGIFSDAVLEQQRKDAEQRTRRRGSSLALELSVPDGTDTGIPVHSLCSDRRCQ
jgi:hypothetical protein